MSLTRDDYDQLAEYVRQATALAELTEERAKAEQEEPQPGDALMALATATVRACGDVQAMMEGVCAPPFDQ